MVKALFGNVAEKTVRKAEWATPVGPLTPMPFANSTGCGSRFVPEGHPKIAQRFERWVVGFGVA